MIRTPKILLACLLAITCSLRAHAAATLTIYDGVNPLITVADNGPGDTSVSMGHIFVVTNVGVWTFTITSAETKPLLGSGVNPQMDLQVQGASTGAGSLRVVFSDNDFGPASGTLYAAVSGQVISGGPVTETYGVWGDPANVVGARIDSITSIGPISLTLAPTLASGSLSLPEPYSLTQVLEIDASGPAGFTSDASFNVPEPGAMVLGALGLVGLASRRLPKRA